MAALNTRMVSNVSRRKDRALEEMTGPEFKAAFGETKTAYRNSKPNKMVANKMTANRGGMTMRKGNMSYGKGGMSKKKKK